MNYLHALKNIFLPGRCPPYIIFFVTSKCNMNCKHCFYIQKAHPCEEELTQEEIENISKSIPSLFFLRISGGEPFLRKGLYQILKSFYHNSSLRRVGITTNGFFKNEIIDNVDRVTCDLKGMAIEIGISVDNLYNKHDEIRSCAGAFQKAMETYDALVGLRKNRNNLRIGFLITLMQDNQYDLEDIFAYLQARRPDGIGLNIIRGKPLDLSQLNVDLCLYNKFRDLLNKYNFKLASGGPFVDKLRIAKTVVSQNIIINTIKTKKPQFECLAGEKIAVLYPNGDVSACEMQKTVLGNIREYNYNFQRLWQAENRKKILRAIKESKCFCTHECFITASQIFRINGILRIAWEARPIG